MRCPNCQSRVHNPPAGKAWRHCQKCDGWFYWQHTSIASMLLDTMETFRGEWFTQQQLIDMLEDRRPGLNPDSVLRSIRVLKSHGKGFMADRDILGETSTGGLILGGRRSLTVEWTTGETLRLRVPQ